jgi:starch-binding outer membrane protein, SusD/RagB family
MLLFKTFTMNYLKYLLILSSFSILWSCKKYVEIAAPKNQLINSSVFADSTDATSAVLGIYITMMQNFALNISSGGLSLYPGLSSDELYSTSTNSEIKDFANNTLSSSNSINQIQFWNQAYKIIYSTNASIEGLTESNSLSENVRNHLIGEVKFVRALIYFNLLNIYGPVPLITKTDYNTNKSLDRSPIDTIYNQILNDLNDSKQLITAGSFPITRIRPNIYSVHSLLSKVHLYLKNWSEAENNATTVINSGIYKLETDLNKIFLKTSEEAIWMLPPVFPGYETWEGNFLVPASSTTVPTYIISQPLLDAFETGDIRKANWIKSNTVNGITYYYPYKYKLRTTTSTPKENYIVFRLSELYLIRAEARAQQNKINGAESAEEDLNKVRNRSNLVNTIAISKSEMLTAIEKERRIELFCEEGNRWFDLKRWNKASSTLSAVKPSWQPSDLLYPIPEVELSRNTKLVQNPGY